MIFRNTVSHIQDGWRRRNHRTERRSSTTDHSTDTLESSKPVDSLRHFLLDWSKHERWCIETIGILLLTLQEPSYIVYCGCLHWYVNTKNGTRAPLSWILWIAALTSFPLRNNSAAAAGPKPVNDFTPFWCSSNLRHWEYTVSESARIWSFLCLSSNALFPVFIISSNEII